MSPSLLPPEWIVPIVSIAATDNVQVCGKHHFGCGGMVLLAYHAHGFSGFLHRQETGPDKLTTCFVLIDVRDCLKFSVFKLIQFYINYNKMINKVITKTELY